MIRYSSSTMERLTDSSARPRNLVHAAWLWALIGVFTVCFTTLITLSRLLGWPFDRQRKLPHWLALRWGRAVFMSHPLWRIRVEGAQRLDPRRHYIFVANHQSLLDIMAICHLNRQFKWVAKEELFRLPFLGWSMSLAGYVKLKRGQNRSIREAYDQAGRWVREGMSVLFFPEGTRSPSGELGAFKGGAFKLASQTGVPVVPIAVSGTRDLLVKGSWRFRGGRQEVRMKVLPPLDPEAPAEELRDRARAVILAALTHENA